MVTNLLTTPLLAMAFGLNPLIAQSYGSGNFHMVGTWLKLSAFCVTLATIPFMAGFFFVDQMLLAVKFDPEVCYLAGVYARFNAIWVIPNSWYVTMRIYFQAQGPLRLGRDGKARPAMWFGLVFLFVNALFLWLLVFGGPTHDLFRIGGLGFLGAAVSISASRVAQCLFYWLYMFVFKKEHHKTWPGMGFDFLHRKYVKPYLQQVLPQVASMLLQFLISQSTTLLVGKLGVLQVDGATAATQATVPFTICLLITFASTTAIRVGMKLGQGHAEDAARTAWLCLLCQAALTVVFGAAVLPMRKELMKMFSNDPEVQQLASELLIPIVLNFLFAGVVSTANGGILASQGRTSLSAKMVMFFELPFLLGPIVILVLVFHADVHLVYWTQAAVTLFECFVLLVIIYYSDWPAYADAARARNQQPPAPRVENTVSTHYKEVDSYGAAPQILIRLRRRIVPVDLQAPVGGLSLVTWNLAAINNNPFEFWISHSDEAYAKLMDQVEAFIDDPKEKDVPVASVFTEDLFKELQEQMKALEWQGLEKVEEIWRSDLQQRKIISGVLKDKDLGAKRLMSMPDRFTNTVNLASGTMAFRPTVINHSSNKLASVAEWWPQWRDFMFKEELELKTGKNGDTKRIRPCQMLTTIKKAKYPAITDEEEAVSIPLQCLCLAIFDAVLVHMLQVLSPDGHWQDIKSSICEATFRKKNQLTCRILESYSAASVICLQEASAAFLYRLRHSHMALTHHVVAPSKIDEQRDQNSAILLRKDAFPDGSEEELTDEVIGALQGTALEAGDLIALRACHAPSGRSFLIASFHGDTNGQATAPLLR
ncbi:Multidrug and toxin extrusion protein 1 (MATE-1) (rMATE-1) (Solute carrier family 47 member 1) [Durusdinium trenchii]|uniref:Multidrug and toxin extrusion protein 1 (MATE-1) (RMATE-1) (Solute carrier family 47 member 1) n=1 Tax=Durusdinium trenchii TaxID=1381693 RepID=A0ABP0KIR7_9DINO